MPSRQLANTMPVRSAPLIAVPGKYGPEAPAAKVGMCRLSPSGAIPVSRVGRVLERNAAAGEVLREAAPGGEIQLLGVLELRQVISSRGPLASSRKMRHWSSTLTWSFQTM